MALKARTLLQLSKPLTFSCSSFLGRSPNSTFITTTPTMLGGGGGGSGTPIFRIPLTSTHISSTPRFTLARHSLQCVLSDDDWIMPPLVGVLSPTSIDPGHYKICMSTYGLEFESAKQVLDHYIQVLAKVVGSVEEAKKRIYFVACERPHFFFGAKIDEQTSHKLQVVRGVSCVLPDSFRDVRDNYAIADPTFEFIPVNWNRRLFNIFDYQKSSQCKMEGDSGHWLINIDQPVDGFATTDEFVDCCSELLATFVGSKEEAKQRIYIIWHIYPFGFGAEIDEETSKKLKDLPNVLDVLPDYAFDIKRKNLGALVIKLSYDGDSAPIPFYKNLVTPDFENWKSSLPDSDGEDICEAENTFELDSDVEDLSVAEATCQLDSDIEEPDLSAT